MATGQIIQKAFNAGYLVEKHLPQLSKLIVKGFQDKSGPFATGFIAGSHEMAKEREQNKSKFLERLQAKLGDKTQAKSKGRDSRDIEIDI